MRTVKNRQFGTERYRNFRGGVVENIRFEKCTFGGEGDLYFANGIRRPSDVFIIRNCEFINCTFYDMYGGLKIGQAIIENVLIENCKTKGAFGLSFDKSMFKHVTIKGKLYYLSISTFGKEFEYEEDDEIQPYRNEMIPSLQELYDENSDFSRFYTAYGTEYLHLEEATQMKEYYLDFYKNVDWALDIRDAIIECQQIHGLFPFDKIKFNPAIAAYINKESLMKGEWKKLIEHKDEDTFDHAMSLKGSIRRSYELENEGVLLIVDNSRPEYHNAELEVIRLLREHGIAEPGETAEPMIIPPKKVKPAVNFKKPVFVFRVTVWTYDHGDGILLANHANSAKKKMMEMLGDLEPDLSQYTAKRENKYDKIAGKLGEKIWHEEEEEFLMLLNDLK